MIDAATNKICHKPTSRLRALSSDPRGRDMVEVLTDLFDLPSELAANELEANADAHDRSTAEASKVRDTESPAAVRAGMREVEESS